MSDERTPAEVLDDHLATSLNGDVEDDLRRNYADDVTVVSNWGVAHGHDGVREMADLLRAQLPDCTFTYGFGSSTTVSAYCSGGRGRRRARCADGVDSYVICDGLIHAQTIFYSLEPPH